MSLNLAHNSLKSAHLNLTLAHLILKLAHLSLKLACMNLKSALMTHHTSVRPSVLPCEALQDLFEVLIDLLRPSGPSDGLLLGLLRLPEALKGSLKLFDAP